MAAGDDRVPLGTYIGYGLVPSGPEISYTLRLMERKLFWLDYKSVTHIETISWHSEGSFTMESSGDSQVVRCEIGGLPGQARVGQVYNFSVERDQEGNKLLVCEGIKCKPQSDVEGGRHLCNKCGLEIVGQLAHHNGLNFHSDCFACDGCSKPLTGPFRMQDDGRRLCMECVPKAYCEACHKEIPGSALLVGDKRYHQGCFTCSICSEPLAGKFFRKKEQILCEGCATGKPAAPKSPTKASAAPADEEAAKAEAAKAEAAKAEAEKVKAEAAKAEAAKAEAAKVEAAKVEAAKAEAARKEAAKAEAARAEAAKAEAARAEAATAEAAAVAPVAGSMTLAELQSPEVWKERSIDASRREEYLSDAAFEAAFGITKADFGKMPKWKRDAKKKELNLF